MSIIYGNLNSDVIRGAINESCIELTINNFMQENAIFDSLLESIDLELVQEKVDFKKIVSKIVESFKKLIEKVKKLASKVISKIQSRSKAKKSDKEGYVEYRDIVFVYKDREYSLKEIKVVMGFLEKDLGLFDDDILLKIINSDEDMTDEWEKYVDKYGSETLTPQSADIVIREKMRRVKESQYDYNSTNRDFKFAKNYLFEEANRLDKELVKMISYLEEHMPFTFNNQYSVEDKLESIGTTKAKAARRLFSTKNFLASYYAVVGRNLFKIATSEPFSQD